MIEPKSVGRLYIRRTATDVDTMVIMLPARWIVAPKGTTKFRIELQKETGATFLHAFDDEHVVAGQGTIGLEILEELEDVDAIVIPVGGGGLIGGIALAAKTLKPDIRIIGVESENADSMKQSHTHGSAKRCVGGKTIADGIAVNEPGQITFDLVEKYVDEIVTVTEDEIMKAIFKLVEKKTSC